jgi:hypothetical protein
MSDDQIKEFLGYEENQKQVMSRRIVYVDKKPYLAEYDRNDMEAELQTRSLKEMRGVQTVGSRKRVLIPNRVSSAGKRTLKRPPCGKMLLNF